MNTLLALTAMAATGYSFRPDPPAAPHSRWRYDHAARLSHAPRGQRAKRIAARRANPHGFTGRAA